MTHVHITARFNAAQSALRGSLSLITSLVGTGLFGCGGTAKVQVNQYVGQTDFQSIPANASSTSGPGGATFNAAAPSNGGTSASTTPTRTVEETDLYRLEGDRLYYLNSYRGLMVFDVSNVDAPKLLGRAPIYGDPIEMIVRNGVAAVVVSDWYGMTNDGSPFHGSIVRGIDATDPTQMKILGEAALGGWVRDTRVVGDVLYAVTEQYPYDPVYSLGYATSGASDVASGAATGTSSATVAVTSVNFAGGTIQQVDRYTVSGQGGVFNVTPVAIMLASNEVTTDANDYATNTGRTILKYLDISDPAGDIKERGVIAVDGTIQGWGADNGRWNLDFADGKTARAIACSGQYCGSSSSGLVLSIVDFSNPDSPVRQSSLNILASSWSPTARFDTGRMYLSPSDSGCYYNTGTSGPSLTPVQIFDTSDPAAPHLAGSVNITGQVWLFMPSGNRLFALGNDCTTSTNGYYGSSVSLGYLDVTDPSAPGLLGTASFGQGWAWTPAAGTFKAFTKNDAEGLVVLPFSGWDATSYQYNNGLQLIEFTPNSIATSGTAKSHGWVERGIFVNNRLVSLSDLALSVVDYTNHAQPSVVAELTLARNVVDVKPQGNTVAELSSDFWGNDQEHSTLRVLPTAQAEDNVSGAALAEIEIDGYNSSVFHNGDLSYVVSNVEHEVACTDSSGPSTPAADGTTHCYSWTQEIQVVDRSNGSAVKRGKIDMPDEGGYWYGGWGWYGCYAWDWYFGADVVQVEGDALVVRRWLPQYANGTYVDSLMALYDVDLSQPDNPTLASTTITNSTNAWWGNLRAIQDKLFAGHYEWVRQPTYSGNTYDPGIVRYYLDQIDLSDRAHPKVAAKINVPGVLVGADENDPSLIYTMDYQWYGNAINNRLEVLQLQGGRASLQGWLNIPGWVGNTFVQGSTAYFTVQGQYDSDSGSSPMSLWQVDLSDPRNPKVLPSQSTQGWGWLLAVQGDRAFVTSGWGTAGIDVFRLQPGEAPVYDQFIRARGWWTNSLARQGNQLFLASGYWGTQVVDL